MQEVKLYKAVALCTNLNPDALPWDRFENKFEAGAEFDSRLRIAVSHASSNSLKLLAYGGTVHDCPVNLRVFAVWAAGVWQDLPKQLHAIAQAAAPVAKLEPTSYSPNKKEGYILKKAAMVKKYSDTWQTIDADFNHASENGLTKAAKATGHGDWFESAALQWAEQRAKRTEPIKQSAPNSVFNLPGKKHTIKG